MTDGKRAREFDPDPLTIELLVQIGVAALGGILARLPDAAIATWRRAGQSLSDAEDLYEQLSALMDRLESHIDEAMALVGPAIKRGVGIPLLLPADGLDRYHRLREHVFEDPRQIDGLAQEIFSHPDKTPQAPREFRSYAKLIEKRMRDASTASTSEDALLEMKQAAVVMHRMLELARDRTT